MHPARTRVLALGAAMALVSSHARAQARPMTPDDVLAMRNVSDPQVSPDGRWVAYVVSHVDLKENTVDSDIYLVATSCGLSHSGTCEPVRLTTSKKSDTSPRWSPDGRFIAFISSREEKAQIFLISPSGGEAERLTDSKAGVSAFQWSPDGQRIAFTAPRDPTPDEERRVKDKDDAIVVDSDFPFARLWTIDVATHTTKQLVSEDVQVSDPRWSPDGRTIAYVAAPTPKADDARLSDIYVVASEGGTPRKLLDNPGTDVAPRWSPDGKSIAFLTRLTRQPNEIGLQKLAVVDLPAGQPRLVAAAFDQSPSAATWSADGQTIYFTAAARTTSQLYSVRAAGGLPSAITNVEAVVNGATFSRDATIVAFTQTDVQHPADVYVARVSSSLSAERVTDHNPQMREIAVGKSEVFRWKGRDGMDLEGVLVFPVDYQVGRRYPLVAFIHGGPAGAWTQSFPGSWSNFGHVFAGRGWVSFYPNPRGSTNYGERFLRANIKDWGAGDYRDIQSGIDALVARGVVDSTRMAQSGWSYGGYMTAWTLTQTRRFKAVMVGAGLTDMFSMYSTNDIPSTLDGYFGAEAWNDTTEYRKRSAMTFIKQARTPTLIQHGQADQRVPIGQAQELYYGLKRNGVPVQLVFYPREGHGLGEPRHQLDKMRREYAWLSKYVLGEGRPLQAGDPRPVP